MVVFEDISQTYQPNKGLMLKFAAIDLAPNDQLETGFCVIDRERHLVRMDKLYSDQEIKHAVDHLGPLNNTVLLIDMPKSLSINSRWRQEEIKMHPLRLKRRGQEDTLRFEERGLRLYHYFASKGCPVFIYFNYWARVNYAMWVPFKSRSPHGCRALQNAIETTLGIKQMPTNLAPSSVLDAMVGAYASWSLWAGEAGKDYEIHESIDDTRAFIAKRKPHEGKPHEGKPQLPGRRGRYFKRRVLHAAQASNTEDTDDLTQIF